MSGKLCQFLSGNLRLFQVFPIPICHILNTSQSLRKHIIYLAGRLNSVILHIIFILFLNTHFVLTGKDEKHSNHHYNNPSPYQNQTGCFLSEIIHAKPLSAFFV